MASTTRTDRTKSTGLPAKLAQVPFRVLRPADGNDVYAYPQPEFRRLDSRGVLHRMATGYYAVVPADADRQTWLPTLEAAAYGIAADYGADEAILMGLSAARLHGAIPRALAVAVVAVPKQRPDLRLIDREATVIFVRRDTRRLDAERLRTDLGTALVTGVEQTILDLAHRPGRGGVEAEAKAAVAALWARSDENTLARLATQQRLRAAIGRAAQWASA